MRIILHPKVHSDVEAIMEYYERTASHELAADFYAELRRFILPQQSGPSRSPSARAIFAALTSIGFLTTFCSVSWAMSCAFSWFGIIEDIRHSASIADESGSSAAA